MEGSPDRPTVALEAVDKGLPGAGGRKNQGFESGRWADPCLLSISGDFTPLHFRVHLISWG